MTRSCPREISGRQPTSRLRAPDPGAYDPTSVQLENNEAHPVEPAGRVADVTSGIPGIEQRYLGTSGLQFDLGAEDAEVGREFCSLFRIS